MKVSIIIPVYNKELYIVDCLKSVLSQTLHDWECLLIDDGSTDKSLLIIREFVNQNSGNWSILCKDNEGPSAARNLGILHAQGEYLAFLDADDTWLPEKLASQVNYMDSNRDVDLSLTNYVIFDTERRKRLRGIRAPSVEKLLHRWLDMRGFGGLVESTGMLRVQEIHDELLFDPSLQTTEGLDFVFKWSIQGRVTVLKQFLTLYRISPGQLHEREDLIRQNANQIAERYSNSFPQTRLTQEFQRAYFFLSNLRRGKKREIFRSMTKALFSLDFKVFQMAFWLIARNIHARILPFNTRRMIRSTLGR